MAINRAEQNWPEEMVNDLDGVVVEVAPAVVLEEESEAEMERRTR